MGFGDFRLIHWMLFLWPVPLVALVVALYLVKRRTGLQGWRGPVLKILGSGHHTISWVMRGLSIAIGFVCRKYLSRLPWKPILIWGPWVVVVVLVGFYAVENWRGARAWERERTAWMARGETLRVKDFMPEQIPDEENFARHPAVLGELSASPSVAGVLKAGLKGFTSSEDDVWNGNPELGIPTDIRLWLPLPGRPTDEQSAARRCLDLLKPIEGQMTGLAQAARRPGCNFDLKAGRKAIIDGWSSPLSFKMMAFARGFESRAQFHLRAGDAGAAVKDLETLLLLREKIDADPMLLGALIEAALMMNVRTLWEGLREGAWSEEHLKRLEELLGRIDFPRRGYEAARCEAAHLVEYYRCLESDRKEVASYSSALLSGLIWDWTPHWWIDLVQEVEGAAVYAMPRGWFDLWLSDSLQRIDRGLLRPNGVKADRLNASMVSTMRRETLDLEGCYMGFFREYFFATNGRYVARMISLQGRVDLMRIAIALERHRLRTGQYPAALPQLVPAELQELPVDLVTGEALHYRIKADGTPLVYAVGFNGIDDGGVPARDPERLDWVWQYTGTPGQTERDWRLGRAPRKP